MQAISLLSFMFPLRATGRLSAAAFDGAMAAAALNTIQNLLKRLQKLHKLSKARDAKRTRCAFHACCCKAC